MTRPRPVRRELLLLLLPLVLAAVAAATWIGLRGLQAQDRLEQARAQLTIARQAAAERQLPEARAAVAAAADDTAAARDLTDDLVWRLVGSVPYLGANVETVRRLALDADVLAGEVVPKALEGLDGVEPARLRRPDGSVDLALLTAVTPAVVESAERVRDVQQDLATLPTAWVITRVAAARDELTAQVDELAGTLTAASTALRLAPPLLGADRPRRFVVLMQQNAESRGTGGLPGAYALVEVDEGRLRVVETRSNADAPDGSIPLPEGVSQDYLVRYGILGALDRWVNINVSPDLPAVARVVAARFEVQRKQAVDGVIALDAQALAAILTGSEPVRLLDGAPLPADQIVEYLGVRQYADFPPATANVNDNSRARKDALSLIASQTAARLTGSGGDTAALLEGLVEAVRSGHLRMASDDPALRLLSQAGVDGALPSPRAPIAYPVLFNSSGSKLDQFVDRSLRYTARGCDGRRASRVEVTLTNRAPAQGLPAYVTTRLTPGLEIISSTEDLVTLNVYATAGSRLRRAALDGVVLDPKDPSLPFLSRFVEGGLPAWAVPVTLPRNTPRTLVLDLDEPVRPGLVQVPVQPLARPLGVTIDAPRC